MAISVATLKAQFTADTAGFEAALKRAADSSDRLASALDASGDRAAGSFDSTTTKAVAFSNVLSGIVTSGVGLLAQGFSSAISVGASFGETLNRIQAVGGASADQLAVINQKALELGAKLPISAQEGADGMLALVSGGMSVEQALSAVEGVAGFAAAQMLDVGSAAEIVSGSLTSFGLGADKASFAADVMSQVANSSAASVQDWGESIKYVGPVAGALKQPIEDMGVAIGLMANQSIKGSSAGTALRTMLTNLAAPSKEVATSLASMGVQTTNAAGQMLPFIGIAEQMRSKMASMTDVQKAQIAETIAGKEGMSGFLAIVNAAPGDFDKMKQSMASAQGATEEFAKATNKGFAFEWGQLQGSIETVLIQGFQAVEPVLSSLTGVATGFVNALGGGLVAIGPQIQAFASTFGQALSDLASGQTQSGVSMIFQALGLSEDAAAQVTALIMPVVDAVTSGLSLVQQAVTDFASGDISSALFSLFSAIGMSEDQFAPIIESLQSVGATAQTILGGIPSLFQAIQGPAQSIASSVGGVLSSAFQAVGQIAQSVFGALPAYISIGMSVLSSLASFVGSTLAAAFQVIGPIAQSVFSGIATVVQTAMPGVMSLASAVGGLLSAAFGALQSVAVSVFNAIQPYIPAVQAAIGSLASAVGGTLNTAFQAAANFVTGTVVPALTNLGQWLADNLPGAIQALANFWTGTLQPAIASVAGWITGTLFPALGELFGWLQAQLPGALQALANFWTGTLQPAIVQVAGWVTGTLFPMFGELVNWLSSTLTGALQTLSDFWGQHGDTILTIAQNTWDTIQAVIDAVFGTITGLWQAFQSAREGDWTGFGEKLRAIWDASWEAIKNVILSAWPVIVQTAKDIVADIQTSFTSIDWHQIGVNIIEGIGAGISSMANSLAQKAAAVAQAAKDAITGFFDMQSPSRVMADVGVNVMAGLEAGLDAGLPGVITTAVGGMRSLLEQINAVLDGIGGAISNSSFEKFRDAASALADGLTAISDAAKLFSGAGMAALSSVADKIRTFAQDARSLLESINLAGIGAISNSNFEKFAAGLKELASGMASIASIGVTFASDAGMPDLRALADQIRTLAADAVALLSSLDTVVPVLAVGLVDRLKALGDAAAGAKSIADGAFGLVQSLIVAMAFNWQSVNFGDAGAMMADLVRVAVFLTQRAIEGLGAVRNLDTSGLAPLKSGLDSILPLASMIPDGIKALVAALAFDWGAVNFSDVGNTLKNLALIAVFLVTRASEGAAGIRDLNTSGLAPLKAALDAILPLATQVPEGVKALAQSMTIDWGAFNFSEIGRQMSNLAQIAVFLATRAAEGAAGLSELPPQLTVLRDAIGLVGDILTGAMATITALADVEVPTTPFVFLLVKLGQIVPLAAQIADATMQLAEVVRTSVTPAATALGASLSLSLGILRDSLSVIETVNGIDLEKLMITPFLFLLVKLGQVVPLAAQIAGAVIQLATQFTVTVTPAATALATSLQTSLGILKSSLDIIGLLNSEDFPDLSGGALGIILTRLEDVLLAGKAIGDKALAVATGWTVTVNPVMERVGQVLSGGLDIVSKTLDIVGQLSGDKFPPLDDGAMSVILTRLEDVLVAGRRIAKHALSVAKEWNVTVNPTMAVVGAVLSAGLDIVAKTLDIVGQLGGDKFPALDDGAMAIITDRLETLLVAGRSIAKHALAVAKEWNVTVNPVMAIVGRVLSDGLDIVSKTLDIVGQLGGDKFPALDDEAMALILTRLEDVLGAGKQIADRALAVATGWASIVNPAMEVVGKILSTGLDIVAKTLDIVGQLSGDKFPALDDGAMAIILTRLEDVLNGGKLIADRALVVATGWSSTVNPAMETVGKILAAGLDIVSKTLDIVGQLGGEKFPALDSAAMGIILTRLEAVLGAGKLIADRALAVATGWQSAVNPAMAVVGKILSDSLDIIGKTLDLQGLLGGTKFPAFDAAMLDLMLGRLAAVLAAGKLLADEAIRVATGWQATVNPAMAVVGKILGDSLAIIQDVLEFNGLKSALLNFRGLDMSIIGPKIDLIFAAAIAIAEAFGRKAEQSNITQAFVDAAEKVSKVLDGAFGALNGALDLGKRLLDPETQIPSVGQVQGKLNAAFAFIQSVTTQFAAAASSMASSGVDFDQVKSMADSAKAAFDVIMSAVETISTLREKHVGMDDLQEIRAFLAQVFGVFNEFGGSAVNVEAVVSAVSSVLGGLANMVDAQAFQAGVDIGTRIADGIAAGLTGAVGVIGASIITAANTTAAPGLSQGTTVSVGGAGGGGGNVTYVYNTDNSKNITVSQVINTTPDNVGKASGGLYSLLASY